MDNLITILICLVAFIHCYILWFEMFAWESRGPKVFQNFPESLFPKTKQLAANQALYNGFLAGGLIWSVIIENYEWSTNIALFFLVCVSLAGIYGACTAARKIFFVQALPALICIVLILVRMCNC